MKTKAKKASSDSENIQVAYFVFDRSELLHLQWTPMCGELLCGFVSYEVFACILGLQPRDKAAMLGDKTKEYLLEKFTWK